MITFLNKVKFFISFDLKSVSEVMQKLDDGKIEYKYEVISLKDEKGKEYASLLDIDPEYTNEYTIYIKYRDFEKAWYLI